MSLHGQGAMGADGGEADPAGAGGHADPRPRHEARHLPRGRPRVMVEPFARELLGADRVVGTELEVGRSGKAVCTECHGRQSEAAGRDRPRAQEAGGGRRRLRRHLEQGLRHRECEPEGEVRGGPQAIAVRYVENKLLKNRGKTIEVNDKDDKDEVDELYVMPDHLKVRKKNMEESSTQWTTGIAEVQLPIESSRLKKLKEGNASSL
ncbi:uncharacterized protein LOC119311907 [Triticum dicoccoides]|uniref:uncharacterized protein LOC119311907 n=1 Tax=Triticum dicoccoides TaxID=85692 RepID=UPI0018913462|nr:uncharacterized protein LOC119311907 [Triticum dicoccoides]